MSAIVWQNQSGVLGKEETLGCGGSVSVTTDREELYETFEHGKEVRSKLQTDRNVELSDQDE